MILENITVKTHQSSHPQSIRPSKITMQLYGIVYSYLSTSTVYQKVNAKVKRSDGSIKKTNEEIRAVIAAANNFASTLRMDITMFTPPKCTELILKSLESTINTAVIHEIDYVFLIIVRLFVIGVAVQLLVHWLIMLFNYYHGGILHMWLHRFICTMIYKIQLVIISLII